MVVTQNQEPYVLSEAQLQAYEDQGFLLIEDFFSPEEHATLKQYCAEFQNWGKEKGKWMQYYEVNTVTGEEQLCRTENFSPYHEGMANYINSDRLLNVLKKLHGEEYVLFKEKVNYKLPGGGGIVLQPKAWHMLIVFSIRVPGPSRLSCFYTVWSSFPYDRHVHD